MGYPRKKILVRGMCLYYYLVMKRNYEKKSSKKSFQKLIISSTKLFYTNKCEDIYFFIFKV